MKKNMFKKHILIVCIFLMGLPVFFTSGALAQSPSLTLDLTKPFAKVSPMLYGLMTEEINHSYDGGLYAELIRNRIFKDNANAPEGWSLVQADITSRASIKLIAANPDNARCDFRKVANSGSFAACFVLLVANVG